MREGKPKVYLHSLADGIHEALVRSFLVPKDDRFLVIHQHQEEEFYYNQNYLGPSRDDDLIVIQILGGKPRSEEVKRAFYADLAGTLFNKIGLKPGNVFVTVTTNSFEDWSFGDGKAQMLDLIKP
jgi:hypothetical protein